MYWPNLYNSAVQVITCTKSQLVHDMYILYGNHLQFIIIIFFFGGGGGGGGYLGKPKGMSDNPVEFVLDTLQSSKLKIKV